MNVKELRIGNIVSVRGEPRKVNSLSSAPRSERISTTIKGCSFAECHFSEQEITPIPLTEECLINLGFAPLSESDHGVRMSVNSLDELNWSRHGPRLIYQTKGSGFSRDYEIKYVHQLQNLYFSLTGKELEVKS